MTADENVSFPSGTTAFQPNPFGPFQQPSQAVEKSNGGEQATRKRGRPRKAAPDKPKAKHPPKAIGAKRALRQPSAGKVEIGVAINALSGLTPDDARFVSGVYQAMQAFSAAQRRRIASTIAALFS